jgi:hypothetical protein
MGSAGRPRKIAGEKYGIPALFVSRDENQGLLDLIARRFRETGLEPTKQDLAREAIADLLRRERLLGDTVLPAQASPRLSKKVQ